MATAPHDDRLLFDEAIATLHAEVANAGAHLTNDAEVRKMYVRRVATMAEEQRRLVAQGRQTWRGAAEQANRLRNEIMELARLRTTPVGKAFAEQIKLQGKTLNELIARKTIELFGPKAQFNALTAAQKDAVYAAIVKSAGAARPKVTIQMSRLSAAGRSLLIMSLALSVYSVATAADKVDAVKREAAQTGAGIAGGVAGGALAGLVCGPGAPVCVTVGAFVGGAAAALGVSFFW